MASAQLRCDASVAHNLILNGARVISSSFIGVKLTSWMAISSVRGCRDMCWVARTCVAGAFLILLAVHGSAFAEPRRVLLLHSSGPHFEP